MTDTVSKRVRSLSDRWLNRSGRVFLPFWLALLFISIAWGWSVSDQNYITAENGLGYWLGILGASMMMLLLTYSLRKRTRVLRRILTMKLWLQFHMALGILGPLLILFHSNFKLGSPNSTVALVCMLLVAASGFVGRYLYSRIHFGLYGEKIKLQQVEKDFQVLKQDILQCANSAEDSAVVNGLFADLDSLIAQHKGERRVHTTRESRKLARECSTTLQQLVREFPARIESGLLAQERSSELLIQLEQSSSILLAALKKLPGLQRYEQLFSLWHVIHIPVFGLMVITAITHVVTVHMY